MHTNFVVVGIPATGIAWLFFYRRNDGLYELFAYSWIVAFCMGCLFRFYDEDYTGIAYTRFFGAVLVLVRMSIFSYVADTIWTFSEHDRLKTAQFWIIAGVNVIVNVVCMLMQ